MMLTSATATVEVPFNVKIKSLHQNSVIPRPNLSFAWFVMSDLLPRCHRTEVPQTATYACQSISGQSNGHAATKCSLDDDLSASPKSNQASAAYSRASPVRVRSELEALAADDSRFRVWFTVSERPSNARADQWSYDVGHMDESMVHSRLFLPGPDSVVFVIERAAHMHPILEKIEYVVDQDVFEF